MEASNVEIRSKGVGSEDGEIWDVAVEVIADPGDLKVTIGMDVLSSDRTGNVDMLVLVAIETAISALQQQQESLRKRGDAPQT